MRVATEYSYNYATTPTYTLTTLTAPGNGGAKGPTNIRIHSVTLWWRMPTDAGALPFGNVLFQICDSTCTGPGTGVVLFAAAKQTPTNASFDKFDGLQLNFPGGLLLPKSTVKLLLDGSGQASSKASTETDISVSYSYE